MVDQPLELSLSRNRIHLFCAVSLLVCPLGDGSKPSKMDVICLEQTRRDKAQKRQLPCTIIDSFQTLYYCVKSPAQAMDSLLHDTILDSNARAIAQATRNATVAFRTETNRKARTRE